MFNYSHLKFPPIKPKKLPKYLFVRNSGEEICSAPSLRTYNAISTTEHKICDDVTFRPEEIMLNGKTINSLNIEFISSQIRNQGVGTALLNFVKTMSKNMGYGGYFHLKASGFWTRTRVPHILYRKYGMTTLNKETDQKLDKFIAEGIEAKSKDFPSIRMYYIPH